MSGVQTSARLLGRWDCGRDAGGRWKWRDISGDFIIKIQDAADCSYHRPSSTGDIMRQCSGSTGEHGIRPLV